MPGILPYADRVTWWKRNLIFVVSPTDTEKGKVHNVRRREGGPLDETKTEVHYEQHRNVGDHRSCRILRHLRHLGILQMLGSSPSRVRNLNEDEGRGKRAAPLVLYLQSICNSLTWGCYNVDV